MLLIAALLGIKTSLQAASSSKPFSMEGFEKSKVVKEGAEEVEADPRDTRKEDYANGDWLEDPMCVVFTCFFPVLFCFSKAYPCAVV